MACNSVCLGKRNRRGMSLLNCVHQPLATSFIQLCYAEILRLVWGKISFPICSQETLLVTVKTLNLTQFLGMSHATTSFRTPWRLGCHNILQGTLEIGMPHHPSGLFGDWDATSFRAPWRLGCHNILQGTLVGGQHQRVDTLLHARTAHDGLQQ